MDDWHAAPRVRVPEILTPVCGSKIGVDQTGNFVRVANPADQPVPVYDSDDWAHRPVSS
jgi:hypothetical protein